MECGKNEFIVSKARTFKVMWIVKKRVIPLRRYNKNLNPKGLNDMKYTAYEITTTNGRVTIL